MLDADKTLQEKPNVQVALPLLTEQCNTNPYDAQNWLMLSACQHQSHQLVDALQSIERALDIEPRHIQARCLKGAILFDLGRRQEALHVYRKALHLAPTDAQLLLNLGIILEETGDQAAALERYDLALRYHSEFKNAWLNRGALLIKLGRLEEALNNNKHLADLHPDWESALFNLGETFLVLERWEEALAVYERTLTINSGDAKVHFGKGLALSMLKRFDQAKQAFSSSQAIDPTVFDQQLRNAATLTGGEIRKLTPEIVYLLKQSTRLDICDWSTWDSFVSDLEHLIIGALGKPEEITEPALLFRTCALPISGVARLALAKSVSASTAKEVNTFPELSHDHMHTKKLRIGYVSPDFRMHPIATVTRHLYSLHSREKFEIYGYSLHPGDGSKLRSDIEQGCDFFRELSGLDTLAAAEIIYHDGIDILIDLAGYTTHARPEIFAMRPATIQASYLGFLHTTGANFIDYFIADVNVLPPSECQFYSEKIAYVSNSYFLFDNQNEISQRKLSREEFGLPSKAFVFCCHNTSYKITPRDFDIWMRLLKRVPTSVLWLYKNNSAMEVNLRNEAEARGVNSDRLVFASLVPNDVYLARYRLADLFLDTIFYNAQTTAADALWAGLPVLSCPGETLASRVASGLLTAIDMTEMIASSPQQYEELAYQLATQPEEMMRIKSLLGKNRLTTPLFNTERQVQKLEAAYLGMWQRHKAGLPPETLHIEP